MLAALMFLLVVIITNYAMMAFSCHGLHVYGAWLNKYHRVDLWLIRIFVSDTQGWYLKGTSHLQVGVGSALTSRFGKCAASDITGRRVAHLSVIHLGGHAHL